MSISFCKGCKYWTKCKTAYHGYYTGYFMFCSLFDESNLAARRKLCNGKYKDKKMNTYCRGTHCPVKNTCKRFLAGQTATLHDGDVFIINCTNQRKYIKSVK